MRLRVSTTPFTGHAEVVRDDMSIETEADCTETCTYDSVPALTMQLLPNAAPVNITTTATDWHIRSPFHLIGGVLVSFMSIISIVYGRPNGYMPLQIIVYQFSRGCEMHNIAIRLALYFHDLVAARMRYML